MGQEDEGGQRHAKVGEDDFCALLCLQEQDQVILHRMFGTCRSDLRYGKVRKADEVR